MYSTNPNYGFGLLSIFIIFYASPFPLITFC